MTTEQFVKVGDEEIPGTFLFTLENPLTVSMIVIPDDYEFRLSVTQLNYVHGIRLQTAMKKVELKFDANNTVAFAQEEAYLRGRMDALNELINLSLLDMFQQQDEG